MDDGCFHELHRRVIMSKFRILMLSSQFMPEVFGGAEQQCLRLSRAFAARGHTVTVLTSRSDKTTPETERLDQVDVVRLWSNAPPQLGGAAIGSSIQWVRSVMRWVAARRNCFDLLHIHQAKMNAIAGALCGRRFGLPTIVKIGNAGRGMDLRTLERKRPFYGRYLAAYLVKHVDRFVAISTCISKELNEYGVAPEKIVFIPNGIDLSDHAEGKSHARATLRDEWRIGDADKVFLFAGRLEKQKNIGFLIDTFAALAKLEPDSVLLLIGDGVDRQALERQAARSGAGARIHFLGRRCDVRRCMQAADFFVLPTLTEGLSNALLEAMSIGLAPISSKVSGSIDAISHGRSGWLFEAGDRSQFLNTMLDALKTPSEELLEIRKLARETATRQNDIEAIATRYEGLYNNVLNGETTTALDYKARTEKIKKEGAYGG